MLLTPMGVGSDTTMELVERASRRWWVPLVMGLTTVTVGIVILAVDWTVTSLAYTLGGIFMISGIFRALTPALSMGARRFDVISGIGWVIVGAAFVAWPDPTLLVVAVFVGATLVFDGIMHLAGAIEFRHDMASWWLSALFGVAIVAIGFLALRRPDLTLSALVILTGLWAIVLGAAEIASAFVLRSAPAEMARGVGGAGAMGMVEETIVLSEPVLHTDEQLALLDQLHLSGGLTDAEYEGARSRMLGSSAAGPGEGSRRAPSS